MIQRLVGDDWMCPHLIISTQQQAGRELFLGLEADNRHVLAAAIRGNANAIVTFNLKDFPEKSVQPYDIDIIHPDDFILYQIDMAPTVCCKAIHDQRAALRNPAVDVDTLLATLQKQQLPQTVSRLREYADFL